MKALLCEKYGPPESLTYRDIEDPRMDDNLVLVDIYSASVNFPDVLMIEDKYQFKPQLPFAPGGEASGVIMETGKNISDLKKGDRVIVSSGFGAFAEKIAVDRGAITTIPDTMSHDIAAAFLMTYGTSHHALKDRAKIQAGETLFVLGAAGGVGLAAIEIGKAMGAEVIAAASSEEKLSICKDHGADKTLLYSTGKMERDEQKKFSDRIKELTDGKGADVVYDPVGGDYAEPSLRATAWEGRYLVIGFAAGDIPKIPLNLSLLKGCQIVGVFWGAFRGRSPEAHNKNVKELMEMFEKGLLRPHISSTYPLKEGYKAIEDLAHRKAKGKVIVQVKV